MKHIAIYYFIIFKKAKQKTIYHCILQSELRLYAATLYYICLGALGRANFRIQNNTHNRHQCIQKVDSDYVKMNKEVAMLLPKKS